jgi:hypothetical protein
VIEIHEGFCQTGTNLRMQHLLSCIDANKGFDQLFRNLSNLFCSRVRLGSIIKGPIGMMAATNFLLTSSMVASTPELPA